MGVEYSRFLVPIPATQVPTCDAIVQLIEALIDDRWLPSSGSPSLRSVRKKVLECSRPDGSLCTSSLFLLLPKWLRARRRDDGYLRARYIDAKAIDATCIRDSLEAGGLLLEYSVHNLNQAEIRFPLARMDHETSETYFDLRLWLSSDYVCPLAENLLGFEVSKCKCGQELQFSKDNDVFVVASHFPLRCASCGHGFDPSEREFRIADAFSGDITCTLGGPVFRFAIEFDFGKCVPESTVQFDPDLKSLCEEVLQCELAEYETVH